MHQLSHGFKANRGLEFANTFGVRLFQQITTIDSSVVMHYPIAVRRLLERPGMVSFSVAIQNRKSWAGAFPSFLRSAGLV